MGEAWGRNREGMMGHEAGMGQACGRHGVGMRQARGRHEAGMRLAKAGTHGDGMWQACGRDAGHEGGMRQA